MGDTPRDTILLSDQIEEYWRNGFLVVRNLFPLETVERWREECDRLWETVEVMPDNPRVQWRENIHGEVVADRIDPILDISPLFRQLATDQRLLELMSRVFGEPAAIMKAKIITKRSGTRGYGLHQDHPYWEFTGIPADHLLTAELMTDVCHADNGAPEVFPGLHGQRIEAPPGEPLDADESRIDMSTGSLLIMEPGDLALIHSAAPHRSAANHSDRSRQGLFFTYTLAQYGDTYARYHSQADPKLLG